MASEEWKERNCPASFRVGISVKSPVLAAILSQINSGLMRKPSVTSDERSFQRKDHADDILPTQAAQPHPSRLTFGNRTMSVDSHRVLEKIACVLVSFAAVVWGRHTALPPLKAAP